MDFDGGIKTMWNSPLHAFHMKTDLMITNWLPITSRVYARYITNSQKFSNTLCYLNNCLTNCTEQSPSSDANNHSTSQEIPHRLWNPRAHYSVKETASGPYPEPDAFSKHLHLMSILILSSPSTPRFSEWSLPFRLSDQNFARIYHPSHACYMPRPSHTPSFDQPNNIW